MAHLEEDAAWSQILRLKDELGLRELAERFGTSPSAVAAAFKRQGVSRTPHALDGAGSPADAPPPAEVAPAPRRAGRRRAAREDDDVVMLPEVEAALARIRPGSKDVQIARHAAALGQVPDSEVARRAGVSVRTIASFRARHDIPGYRGPRRSASARGPRRSRIDPFAGLLGQVPDRVVAEKAGVSLNAVRNYRVKRGIPAAGRDRREASLSFGLPAAAAPAGGERVWSVGVRDGGQLIELAVVADSLSEAVEIAAGGVAGEVVSVRYAGALLAG